MFFKIGVLKNFRIFQGICLCWSEGLQRYCKVFAKFYYKILKKSFSYRTPLVVASREKKLGSIVKSLQEKLSVPAKAI